MARKIKLLIVDDEVKFLNSLTRRLELRGFEVTKAENGQDALDYANESQFDLAMVDLKMPGVSGKQGSWGVHEIGRFQLHAKTVRTGKDNGDTTASVCRASQKGTSCQARIDEKTR
jgi:ActR/RegA family two-component response regulator